MSKPNGPTDSASSQLIVQKYGGATLADPTLVRAAAERIAQQSKQGPLIVVVSAMGTTTNSLIDLANQVSRHPARRELDMLLSVGERISMSLMSMALQDLGVSAISFTGSQAGILTDEDHFNAKIIDVKAHRVEEALKAGKVVILAGFQGVSPITKEITTLGRGGSDVTAVAMAAAFKADRCEILKEVPAVFTADPRLVKNARPLNHLGYDELLEMTFWGAKVLHHRSVELARARRVPLYIGPAADRTALGTLVSSEGGKMFEVHQPLSLNSHECVLEIELPSGAPDEKLHEFRQELSAKQIASPQVLGWRSQQNGSAHLYITAPAEVLKPIRELLSRAQAPKLAADELCSVSLTCSGGVSADLSHKVLQILRSKHLTPRELRVGSSSLTLFMKASDRLATIESLHTLIPAPKA